MTGGGTMGYDIPVSLSMASTVSSGSPLNAETVFNFAPNDSAGGVDLSGPDAPATAVASTAQGGNSSAAASGTGVGTPVATGSSSSLSIGSLLIYGGLAVAAWMLFKHMKGGA